MKKRTSLYIDADLLEKAKRKFNLSQLLEWAIIKALNGELEDLSSAFRVPSRRGPRVQIPPPAWFYFEDLHFKRLLCSYLLLQISDF